MKPKVIMGQRGQKKIASHIEYRCVNPETGCNYMVESNAMAPFEMKGLRDDGSTVKL